MVCAAAGLVHLSNLTSVKNHYNPGNWKNLLYYLFNDFSIMEWETPFTDFFIFKICPAIRSFNTYLAYASFSKLSVDKHGVVSIN